ncbi:MAG: adenylate/guanylate cyclase domain-containing protein [Chloroflexota bacterium]
MTSPPATAVRTAEGAIAFTDLSGFTEFCAIKGDEAAVALISAQERLLRDEIGRRGRIVKNLGDGFMLFFADPCDAVVAGLSLQDKFEEASFEGDFPLWVRIGIHFGAPVRHGRDLVGHDVNVAARIVDLAAPGEVLVSASATSAMTRRIPNVAFEEVGPVIMKGIPEAMTLYRAMRA